VAKCILSRWAEFLTSDPREANSEGGVLPAIWGTVTMTLLMSWPWCRSACWPHCTCASTPPGLLVSTVRIAVNNLAGVPSIVFGVFGLGFFCYMIGASIDQLFFESKLPSPTFGTGGLMWASLTLALLTLPVVIVATEEALAAVPRSMREGSLACGASKWQTDPPDRAAAGHAGHHDRHDPGHGPRGRRGGAADAGRGGQAGPGTAGRRRVPVRPPGTQLHASGIPHLRLGLPEPEQRSGQADGVHHHAAADRVDRVLAIGLRARLRKKFAYSQF
jgi:hypothetical protein